MSTRKPSSSQVSGTIPIDSASKPVKRRISTRGDVKSEAPTTFTKRIKTIVLPPMGIEAESAEDDSDLPVPPVSQSENTSTRAAGGSSPPVLTDSREDEAELRKQLLVPVLKKGLGKHITVEAPSLPHQKPYIEKQLPGIADEVESYPCKLCTDRVFLTSFGLERHAKMAHPEQMDEVLSDITRIQEEWQKREVEREKARERLALAKIRQEALAAAAHREAIHAGTSSVTVEDVRPKRLSSASARTVLAYDSELVGNSGSAGDDRAAGSGVEKRHFYNDGTYTAAGNVQFESCRICGLLINAEHPTAMENHMRAHKKNDQLRKQLDDVYGPEFVARVTCHECQLVFTDERKLIAHAEAMHVRRRKYVCKWCGRVCLTMSDLNAHKAEVHGAPVSRSRDPDVRRQKQLAQLTKGHGMPPPLGAQSAAIRRSLAMKELKWHQDHDHPTASTSRNKSDFGALTGGGRVLTSVEELPCRTTCDCCGLIMVKPSLLIRHMLRVHNRSNFSTTIETKGMPPFKATLKEGKLSWSCCSTIYQDRGSFLHHRKVTHAPKIYATHASSNSNTTDAASFSDGSSAPTGEDQFVLLVVHDTDTNEQTAHQLSTSTAAASSLGVASDGQQLVVTAEQLRKLGIDLITTDQSNGSQDGGVSADTFLLLDDQSAAGDSGEGGGADIGRTELRSMNDASGEQTSSGHSQEIQLEPGQQLVLIQTEGEEGQQLAILSSDGDVKPLGHTIQQTT